MVYVKFNGQDTDWKEKITDLIIIQNTFIFMPILFLMLYIMTENLPKSKQTIFSEWYLHLYNFK